MSSLKHYNIADTSVHPYAADMLHPPCTAALDARRARPRPKNILAKAIFREREREREREIDDKVGRTSRFIARAGRERYDEVGSYTDFRYANSR